MKKVGIVMPAINLWEKYTRPALESVIRACAKASAEDIHTDILLINNASTDATAPEAAKLESVEVRSNAEMWGFQKSVNFGSAHFIDKSCDYVLVLNNDIVLHEQAIVQLVDRMKKGDMGMATCIDVSGEMNAQQLKPNEINRLSVSEKFLVPEAPNPHFSAFMVSTNCWKDVGEFDEVFAPAYYEDNDYHYRMKLAGVNAVLYPPAMFYHYGSRTQNEALDRPLTMSQNQHHFYIRKWGDGPGKERYTHPYNDPGKPITWTKQMELSVRS